MQCNAMQYTGASVPRVNPADRNEYGILYVVQGLGAVPYAGANSDKRQMFCTNVPSISLANGLVSDSMQCTDTPKSLAFNKSNDPVHVHSSKINTVSFSIEWECQWLTEFVPVNLSHTLYSYRKAII